MEPCGIAVSQAAEPGSSSLGRTAAWTLFCVTAVHLAFMQPYAVVIPGERAKVFSGMFCAATLIAALFFAGEKRPRITSPAVLISLGLTILVILSCALSLTPGPSSARGFVMLASGLGGFWCARLLLDTDRKLKIFQWLCCGLLAGIVILCVLGSSLGRPFYELVDTNWHPVLARLILLCFAPIALLGSRSRWAVAAGALLLCSTYAVLIQEARIGVQSAVGIPAVLCFVAALFFEWGRKQLIAIVVSMFVLAATIGNHFVRHTPDIAPGHISIAYRAENVFFSARIAAEHPLLGIGLWAPRDEILQDYQTKYPRISRHDFIEWTKQLRTSESSFLTFLADLGIPFTLIYAVSLLVLMLKLLEMVFRPPQGVLFHPLALFLPLTGALLHFQLVDGLFQPQVSWFFHILLGLIPVSAQRSATSTLSKRGVVIRAVLLIGILTLGASFGYLAGKAFG